MNEQLSFDFGPALPEWAKNLAVFDLETTGLDLSDARIVTACALRLDETGQIVGSNSEWLADPVIEIPTQASDVHGVTTEIARRDGRPAAEVVEELLETIRDFFKSGIPVVAYNAPYDFTILHYEALRHGFTPIENPGPIIDPLVIDKYLSFRKGKRRLENAAEFYGVELTDAHNATADAVAAGRVAQAIAKTYAQKLPESAQELHNLQILWSEANDASFEKYMRSNVNPDFVVARGWPLKLTK
ncbi:exonuclease domain-containing protein [Rhodoluna sp.]|uniref:exonuclease domain-containing protein n=1 Tax=Rhodoluna sp. TaxID=1969481 RepID=UPI0025CD14E7|nr:exonuclease domain-containing protein [Rhodoluna sp.]